MKTIAILQTFDPKSATFTELERHEVRATPPDRFLNDPPGVLIFGGQLYTAVPLHLRPPRVFAGGTLPDNGLRSDGPELVLELPYVLAEAYDLELDQVADRLYSPAEASDLVERVREPLDRLVQAIDAISAHDDRGIGGEVVDHPRVMEALGGTRQILALLRPIDDEDEA